MRAVRIGLTAVLALVLLAGLALAAIILAARRPVIGPVGLESQPAFEPQAVQRGASLAALGTCITCHTRPGGPAYAGGRPIATPFGVVYATNITPDPQTGIGLWPYAAFSRALREGVGRSGEHLYPAFPYPHFARLTAEDTQALYAFLMTRTAVSAHAPPNRLAFPLGWRPLLALWKLLFLHPPALPPPHGHSAGWARGAYLVLGLGHCGDCHSPRGAFGQEHAAPALGGGHAEGWDGPALNARAPAPVPWSAAELARYLRTGFEPLHGAAAGPMAEVCLALGAADPAEIDAMAEYLASIGPAPGQRREGTAAAGGAAQPPRAQPGARAPEHQLEAQVFSGACAGCHNSTAPEGAARAMDLALSPLLGMPDALDAARIIAGGIQPPPGRAGPQMPPFAGALTAPQLAALLDYLRAQFSDHAPWSDLLSRARQAAGDPEER